MNAIMPIQDDETGLISRRAMIAGSGAGLALLLAGCQSMPGLSLTEAIRRLLNIASSNALAMLARPGGFYDSQIARIDLPAQLGGNRVSNVLEALLRTGAFRGRLEKELNRVAERGADAAAPLIAEAVRNVSINDALALVRGGPQAATEFLRGAMGESLVTAMVPAIGDAIRIGSDPVVAEALRAATGIDLAGLVSDVTAKADRGIWQAIGAEEALIRANPGDTNDPLLIAVFGVGV